MRPETEYEEEQTLEMRVTRRARIASYLLSLDAEVTAEGRFRGPGWEIELSEEQAVPFGAFTLPATFVTIRCRRGLLQQVIDSLRRKFMAYGA
ncbi:MAG: hypothetical protein AB1640_25765 [bacterium]